MLSFIALAGLFALTILASLPLLSGVRGFRGVRRAMVRFAQRRLLAIWVLFFTVIVFRLLLLPALPVPTPGAHDEFSYLLMGDTFAHGRLANPTHPMWISFETFHVNWSPTYCSMYPPAQGFVLAVGQWLGHPWIGVLLSTAAMCAAILWMLQGWMPAHWALIGGLLAALKFGFASYWMNSYWGGAAAAIGGALVLGALPRILRRARPRDALLMGLGIAVLANSRPYEGLLLCVPVATYLLWWLRGKTKRHFSLRDRLLKKVVTPLALVLVLTAIFMGFYNWRLTGNARLLPHTLNRNTYHWRGVFVWQRVPAPVTYRNQQFEDFYNGWERTKYQNTWSDLWYVSLEKFKRCAKTYFGWGTLLLLPGIPFVFRDRKMRLLWSVFFIVAVGIFAVIWSMPHYAAPAACAVFALLIQAMRHVRTMRLGGWPVGLVLSGAAVLLIFGDTAISLQHHVCDRLTWTCKGDPARQAIQERLASQSGKQLVIVRYASDHDIHNEWVYNGAKIDSAKVLWARHLDQQQDARLAAYFKDRQISFVEPDKDKATLIPYQPPETEH